MITLRSIWFAVLRRLRDWIEEQIGEKPLALIPSTEDHYALVEKSLQQLEELVDFNKVVNRKSKELLAKSRDIASRVSK